MANISSLTSLQNLKIMGKEKGNFGMDVMTQPKRSIEKVKYSDTELGEFKILIQDKLNVARECYNFYKGSTTNNNGTDDTSPSFKILEEGNATMSKEEAGKLAERQFKFIKDLEAAMVRIENKTYGVCRATGVLISKERLRAVPHATLSIGQKTN